MMEFKSVKDVDVGNKTVIMRVDYNLPLDEQGRVTDHTRLSITLKTLNYVLNKNGKIVLVAHLGRPENREKELRMNVVADSLSKLLGKDVKKLDGCIEDNVHEEIRKMKPGEVILLENVRFYPEEKEKDDSKREEFAEKLAKMGDIYVNEAFAVSHRNHASVTGIPKFMPGCCGLSFMREVNMINSIVKNPEKPYIAIIGGAKGDKMLAVENLLPKVDRILMGGVIGNTFLKAKGIEIGNSKYDEGLIDKAKKFMKTAGDKIVLPVDAMVENEKEAEPFPVEEVTKDMKIMDIGPETIVRYKDILRNAETVIWAGPLGKFEKKPYEKGTLYIASFISGLYAKTLVGGGDSIAAMQKLNMMERMTHISTGGGAFVDFITKEKFPGVEALKDSYKR
ncbi:MAG: phosphoglycerate kinase, partial [Candidatus Aenigmatarchaeota archaeon]